jgi:uncharacterized protein YoaH (UPF0181 family)
MDFMTMSATGNIHPGCKPSLHNVRHTNQADAVERLLEQMQLCLFAASSGGRAMPSTIMRENQRKQNKTTQKQTHVPEKRSRRGVDEE